MGEMTLTDITTWLSSAALVAILGLLSKHWLAEKKDRLTAHEVERAGFTSLISQLQTEVTRLREQHASCESKLSEMAGSIQAMQIQMMAISLNNNPNSVPDLVESLRGVIGVKT